jgi:hypothetical protein
MVITDDMDWISVLNDVRSTRCINIFPLMLKTTGLQHGVVFPEPEDLCARILNDHELEIHQGWYLSNHLSAEGSTITVDRYCTTS